MAAKAEKRILEDTTRKPVREFAAAAAVFFILSSLSVLPSFAQNNNNHLYNNGNNGGYNGITGPVSLKSIAVLPLENLSDNPLAADIIKDYIKKELSEKGDVSIASEDSVEKFLAEKRVRYTGAVTRMIVREMGKVLGVDAVLLGSVDYYSTIGNKLIVGVNVRLVSAVDGSIIWADNLTYTGRDFEGILGLGVVKSLDTLASIVVKDMVGGMAGRFFVRESVISPFEIERVIVYPTIGRGGGERELKIKFLPLFEEPKEVKVVVGEKEIILSKEGSYEYGGMVSVPEEEGMHLVNVVVAGQSESPFLFDAAAKMVVDNIPPKMDMTLSKSIFSTNKRGSVTFEPKILSVDEIDEWKVDILDSAGNVVRGDRGYQSIPKKLMWRGESEDRGYVEDGKYTFRLMIKDTAGNESIISQVVWVKNNPPVINVTVTIVGEAVLFSFNYNPDEPIQSWQFSITDRDGNTLKRLEGQGKNIPEKMEYPLDKDHDIRNLSFTITADDVAGNTFKLTKAIPSLFANRTPFAELKGKNEIWQDF